MHIADGTYLANGVSLAGAGGPLIVRYADGSYLADGSIWAGLNYEISEALASSIVLSALTSSIAGKLGDALVALSVSPGAASKANFVRMAAAILGIVPAAAEKATFPAGAGAGLGISAANSEVAAFAVALASLMRVSVANASSANYPRTAAGRLGLSPAAGEVANFPVTASSALSLIPAAAEIAAFLAGAGITVSVTPTSVSKADYPCGASAAFNISPSAAEIADFAVLASSILGMSPAAMEIACFVSTSAITLRVNPSPASSANYPHAASIAMTITPASGEAASFLSLAAAILGISPSNSEKAGFAALAASDLSLNAESSEVADFVARAAISINLRDYFWGAAWGYPATGGVSNVFASIIPKSQLVFQQATQRIENIINQCPASYGYSYATGAFLHHTDDSDYIDVPSQGIYGVKTPSEPYQFHWCRDKASVQKMQAIIVQKFRTAPWDVDIEDITMNRLHVDIGNYVIATIDHLYNDQVVPLINQYWRVLSVKPNPAESKINFRLLQTDYYLTIAQIADGSCSADGAHLAGNERDMTIY